MKMKPNFEACTLNVLGKEEIMDQRQNVIFQYSSKNLTRASDKLPALSGLAQRFRNHDLGSYVAGLWEKIIHLQLLWFPDDNPERNRSTEYTAPTWSWASVLRNVYFGRGSSDDFTLGTYQYLNIVGSVFEVRCIPSGKDPFGSVSDGYLKVRSKMIQATSEIARDQKAYSAQPPPFPDTHPNYRFRIVNDTDGSSRAFSPDSISDIDILSPQEPVFCLLWALSTKLGSPIPENGCITSYAIVLRPSKSERGTFERLGLLKFLEDSEGFGNPWHGFSHPSFP